MMKFKMGACEKRLNFGGRQCLKKMLEEKIAELRILLYKAKILEEADEDTVLAISRELDKYIVEYMKRERGQGKRGKDK